MNFDLRKQAIVFAAAALAPLAAALGQIQDVGGGGIRVFEPVYFDEFDPITALDMVNRMPGVNPQESNGGRGLSGVRSNILIDGIRPPPKGKSIREQLDEMPVAGVALIELIDAGARLDIDMQGYPQVINVITVENRPAYYEVATEFQRSGTGDTDQENQRVYQLDGTGSFFLRDHEFSFGGNLQDLSNRSPADFVAIDPANPEQRISSLNSFERHAQGLRFDANFALPGASTLSFNSQFASDDRGSAPISLVGLEELESVDESFEGSNDLRDFSAEYRRPLASNGELMVAVVDSTFIEQSESDLRTDTVSRSSFNDRETGETAARLLVTNSPTQRLTVRTTVTSAFNYFEGGFRIFENGAEIIIGGSTSRVEEDRRSLEGAVDWNFTDKWSFRGALGVESYDIDTRDVAHGVQTDPKGEIALSFRPQPRTTYTLQSSRSVGQLSFGQFLASSSLSSEILTAGASELEPERSSNVSAIYDRRFGDQGVLRFTLSRSETENPVRSVALSETIVVSQNTSPETVDRLQASVDFPLERFGREDLVVSIGGMISDSETIDPITGETRGVSGSQKSFKQIELRKDPGAGRWSWSMSMRQIQPNDNYSARQIRSSSDEREWRASVTFEPINGLKLRANLDGPRDQTRDAYFYPAVREPGLDPSFVASTTTRRGAFASFTVEWRRERLEITGSLSSRPEYETVESLTPFGESFASILKTEIARTPRAMLRFRVIN